MSNAVQEVSVLSSGTAPASSLVSASLPLIGASGLASRALIDGTNSPPATLESCFAFVSDHSAVPEYFQEEIAPALTIFEEATGCRASQLTPAPVVLRPILAKVALKEFRTSHKRWSVFTVLQSVLILTGWVSSEARLRYKLKKPVEALLIAAAKHGRRRPLAAFFRYCDRTGVDLPSVSTETLVAYVDWLACHTLIPNPWSTALKVQSAWNFMREHHRSWPSTSIQLPPRRESPFAARMDLRCEPLIYKKQLLANRSLIDDPDARPIGLGACLLWVATHPEVSKSFAKAARTALAKLGEVTGQDVARLPTLPVALRPILAQVDPFQFDIFPKRWENIRSVVSSTLILTGWIPAVARKRSVLPEPWATLITAAKKHDLHRPLAPFFRYCHPEGLTPEQISTDTLLAYIDWLTQSTLKENPRQTGQTVLIAWRRMQRCDPGWPRAELDLPTRRVYKRRLDFVAEFYADTTAYLDSLRKYHPRDPTYRHPLSAAGIRNVRNAIIRAATFLANAGTPVADIIGIASLVAPTAFEVILLAALNEAGGQWNVLAKHIGDNLLLAAKRWVKPTEEVICDLEEQCRCVRVRYSYSRRRDLLAQFATEEDLKALFDLPWRAFERAEKMLKKAKAERKPLGPAARLHETALALALLLAQPIRIGNLVALDIERHFRRDRRGKLSRIFIEGRDVKNGQSIEILLEVPLAERFQRDFDVFRPIRLRDKQSTALFAGEGGRPMRTHTMGDRLRRLVKQQIGAHLTAHLLRHLAVERILDDNPNNLPIAQRLLNHTKPETTARIYGMTRTSSAQRVYAKLIERDRLAIAAKERPRGRKKQ